MLNLICLFISLTGCVLFSAGGTSRFLNWTFTNIQITLLRSFCPMPDTQASIPLVCDEQWTVEEYRHTTLILIKCSQAPYLCKRGYKSNYHKISMPKCSLQKCFYSNSTFMLDLPFPQQCKLMSLNRVCHILFQQGLVGTSPMISFLPLLNHTWFYWLSCFPGALIKNYYKIETDKTWNENYFGCGRFVIIMIACLRIETIESYPKSSLLFQ